MGGDGWRDRCGEPADPQAWLRLSWTWTAVHGATIEDGQWLDDTLPYGTVHRLASAGKHKGVASAVLDWSMEHCQSLRADTHADNKIMQHLLEKNGFTRCGIIHVADGSPRFAYQKLAPTQPLG